MAQRVLQQTCTIPAGTTAGAPVTVTMPFDHWQIEAIDLEVPPGPAGTMGFYLANNSVPWIPRTAGEWLIWDDHVERFPADDYPTASGWAVIGYNVGEYQHSVVVRFHVNATTSPTTAAVDLPVLTFVERDIPPAIEVVL